VYENSRLSESEFLFSLLLVDCSRVVLNNVDPEIPGSDYINASYIFVSKKNPPSFLIKFSIIFGLTNFFPQRLNLIFVVDDDIIYDDIHIYICNIKQGKLRFKSRNTTYHKFSQLL